MFEKHFFHLFHPLFTVFSFFCPVTAAHLFSYNRFLQFFFVGERVLFLQDLFCIFTSAVAFFLKTSKSISIWAASYRFPFVHPSFHKLWGETQKKNWKKKREGQTPAPTIFSISVYFFFWGNQRPIGSWHFFFKKKLR